MAISERIRAAMTASGVSQVELARMCGVKPPSVHGWLTGKAKFLRGENLLKVAEALDVDQQWLATGKGSMQRAIAKNGGGSADSLKLTKEELSLLAVYRRAANQDPIAKAVIDDAVTIASELLDAAVLRGNQG